MSVKIAVVIGCIAVAAAGAAGLAYLIKTEILYGDHAEVLNEAQEPEGSPPV
jgi:hypothetical protein